MTIDQLLEKSSDELEKMTDKELEEYLSPFFVFCRPESNPLKELLPFNSSKITSSIIQKPTKKPSNKLMNAAWEEAQRRAERMGLKI